MDIKKAIDIVQLVLTDKRFSHTISVVETAETLARSFGVSVEKAKLAAVLHDYAKHRKRDEMERWILNSTLPKDLLDYHHEIWHGPVGALMLQFEHGLNDREVLGAIACHTTGKANMTDLDLILYVADYIEPGRNFTGLDEVRVVAEQNLLKAAWMISRNSLNYFVGKGTTVYPDSFHMYNDLTNKMNVEGFQFDE